MGLDQTQPPFFPILDLEWANVVRGAAAQRGRDWLEDRISEGYFTRERVEDALANAWPSTDTITISTRVPDPDAPDEAFLRTWAANIADEAKEPSQDA